MDLQGIGAISAAAVALVGIPSAILIGRWQMRGALRTAEETGRAGIAQAEATYRAALDSVRAEASVANAQWRRGVQRDAYVALLLASGRVTESAKRLNKTRHSADEMTSLFGEFDIARAELETTFLVVVLEGPEAVAEQAQKVMKATRSVASLLGSAANRGRLWKLLERMDEEATAAPPPANHIGPRESPARRLMRSMSELWTAQDRGGSSPSSSARRSIENARRAVEGAMREIPQHPFDYGGLLDLWDLADSRVGIPAREVREEEAALVTARAEFIRTARLELDGTSDQP